MRCATVCPGCEETLWSHDQPGVITSFHIRVLHADWSALLITMKWDQSDNSKPQVDKVSLGKQYFRISLAYIKCYIKKELQLVLD